MPARVVGHSPFARYSHSPRTPLPVRPVEVDRLTRDSGLGVGLLVAVLTAGVLVGLLLTAFWKQIVTLAAFGLLTVACAAFLNWIDPKGGGR